MAYLALLLLAAAASSASEARFELHGKVFLPRDNRSPIIVVGLSGSDFPYFQNGQVLNKGTYHFKKLPPGIYVLSAWARQYGLYEESVQVNASVADQKHSINVDLHLDQHPGKQVARGTGMFVSVRQLSIPQKARDEFSKAYQALAKHDEAHGVEHLEKAISIAPQFAEALNTLGTVYHHRGDAVTAEQYFRESLKQNPHQYSAAVNLSSALYEQHRYVEALQPARDALAVRPRDPRALTQQGWVLLQLGRLQEALASFQDALSVSPEDISRPQLGVAAVYMHTGDATRERQEIEDYLRRHPNDPEGPRLRARLEKLQ